MQLLLDNNKTLRGSYNGKVLFLIPEASGSASSIQAHQNQPSSELQDTVGLKPQHCIKIKYICYENLLCFAYMIQ